MKHADTSWGGVAEWYDDLLGSADDTFQNKVIMPHLLRILDPKPGMRIIDIACGQGYFSRAFAAAGAQVIGCDISAELVALATAASKTSLNLSFSTAPAHRLKPVADAWADAATIVLALQNIEDLPGAMLESARVLKPGGRLIIILNHPAFRIPRRSSWGWDGTGGNNGSGLQYRRIDAYMSEDQVRIDMTPGEREHAKKRFTVSFHRPLQVYFKALSKAGFSVTRLEEWNSHRQSQKGPRAAEEDRMRKEIPMFLALEARRS